MEIEIKDFSQLSNTEVYEILRLRNEVFVVEQQCIYQDADGEDEKAFHLLGTINGTLVAYLRIFKSGDYFKAASIGRVVVSKSFRKKGYANKIMLVGIDYISTNLKEKKVKLSAQAYLTKFYNDLGFQQQGEEYLEDGIPHIAMILEN